MTSRPVPGFLRSLVLVAGLAFRQIAWSRRTVVMCVVLLIPTVLALVVRRFAPPGSVGEYQTHVFPTLQLGLTELLGLFFAASTIRDAQDDRTLTFLLTRPLGRLRTVFGLYMGTAFFLVPLSMIAASSAWIACRAGLPDGIFGSSELNAGFRRLLLVFALAPIQYAALFTMFGLVLKYPTILGIVFIFFIEVGMASLGGAARLLAPISAWESLLTPWFVTRASMSSPILGENALPHGTAFLLAGIHLAVFLFFIAMASRRRDFVAASVSSNG